MIEGISVSQKVYEPIFTKLRQLPPTRNHSDELVDELLEIQTKVDPAWSGSREAVRTVLFLFSTVLKDAAPAVEV